MTENKAAFINISKVLARVSFVTLAAVGSASGNMVAAGLTAVPAAVMTVGPTLAKLKEKKEAILELDVPHWWTSDSHTWDGLCKNPSFLSFLPILDGLIFINRYLSLWDD